MPEDAILTLQPPWQLASGTAATLCSAAVVAAGTSIPTARDNDRGGPQLPELVAVVCAAQPLCSQLLHRPLGMLTAGPSHLMHSIRKVTFSDAVRFLVLMAVVGNPVLQAWGCLTAHDFYFEQVMLAGALRGHDFLEQTATDLCHDHGVAQQH
jgi:hypothetical protein